MDHPGCGCGGAEAVPEFVMESVRFRANDSKFIIKM
jgi:hypothetical protein